MGMDLYSNLNPRFTHWVVADHLLKTPFVCVDVGCQFGPQRRWQALGACLEWHGIDPLREAIAGIPHIEIPGATIVTHECAVGEREGETELHVYVPDPCQSSLYPHDPDFSMKRVVPLRTLDAMLADGTVPQPDFLEVDVESYEEKVFAGATTLTASGLTGIEFETNFNFSPNFPDTHFIGCYQPLCAAGYVLFDMAFDRQPRAVSRALGFAGRRPTTFNMLLSRDYVKERREAEHYPTLPAPPDADRILKSAIVFELYGMADCAVELLHEYAAEIGDRVDIDKATALLGHKNTMRDYCSLPWLLARSRDVWTRGRMRWDQRHRQPG